MSVELWWIIAVGVTIVIVFLGGWALGRRRLPPSRQAPALPDSRDEAPARDEEAREGEEEKEAEEEREARAETPAVPVVPKEEPPPSDGLFKRLVTGLSKTQGQLVKRLDHVFRGRGEIDDALYEELETVLLTADVGIRATQRLLDAIKRRAERDELSNPEALRSLLQDEIRRVLSRGDSSLAEVEGEPTVILVVGVNGAGKTTTIGKLASRYREQGRRVLLGAGDTFRAAAIEQLEVWADRAKAEIVKNKEGSDPSAVIFDAIKAGQARGVDVVIADTAGRLHTKSDLMDELKKVTRVAGKAQPGAPHEVLLVLDATMGQNALAQARVFHEGCSLTGLILTKLDGTARGGVIIAICDELQLPVKFIGIGEKVEDLRPFDPDDFVRALFS